MLFLHPINQLLSILLALYVFFLGLQRVRSLYLNHNIRFNWKRHVTLGVIALVAMFVGLLGGMAAVYFYWRGFQITGAHAKIAFFILPFLFFGFFSGFYMNRIKKKRKLLPFIHGIGNLVLLILACFQIVTGWGVYVNFIR